MRRRFSSRPKLEKEQLFEDQPAMRRRCPRLQLGQGSAFRRKMHLAQRCFAIGHIEPGQHRCRQAFRHIAAYRLEQVENHLALPARSQPRAAQRFVDGRDAADFQQPRFGVVTRVGQDLKLRLNHFQIAVRSATARALPYRATVCPAWNLPSR